jgi:hypothetical protein
MRNDVQMGIPLGIAEEIAARVAEHREIEAAKAAAVREEKDARRIARARNGTPHVARRDGYCPMCRVEIEPGDPVVIMDNYHPYHGHARSDAFCPPCAAARGFEAGANGSEL